MKLKRNPKLRLVARLFLTAVLSAVLAAAQLPPALFAGTVHGISKKQITIETAEGNLVDFDINKKTQVLRGKKKIAVEDLETGDVVSIEAKQEIGQFLVAVTITAGAGKKQ